MTGKKVGIGAVKKEEAITEPKSNITVKESRIDNKIIFEVLRDEEVINTMSCDVADLGNDNGERIVEVDVNGEKFLEFVKDRGVMSIEIDLKDIEGLKELLKEGEEEITKLKEENAKLKTEVSKERGDSKTSKTIEKGCLLQNVFIGGLAYKKGEKAPENTPSQYIK